MPARKCKLCESSDADDVKTDVKPEKKKTKPAPSVSQPAPKKTPAAKPVTAKEKFEAVAIAEEETALQALKVKESRVSA